MKLSEATKIMVGASEASKVCLGSTELWTPPSSWTPPVALPGIIGWFEASDLVGLNNDDPTPEWPDPVGGASFLQAAGDSKPLYKASAQNGQPALWFDHTDDFMMKASLAGIKSIIAVGNWARGGFPGTFDGANGSGMVTCQGNYYNKLWLAGSGLIFYR